MLRMVCVTILAAVLTITTSPIFAEPLTRFDFEDGTLQGWTIVSGEAGRLPTGPETMRKDITYGQQGSYFIGLYENPSYDAAKIVLQSPVFTVRANTISLLVGGGDHYGECYVALHRAADNSEIARETGKNLEYMTPRYWDVSKLKGQQVYVKIVDSHTGGWGHINVDDIHEMTDEEERARAEELAARKKRYERWLTSVDAPSKRIVYSGKALGDVFMPLGGIGGGHLSISGGGAVRQWCIFNRVNEGCVVPDSFFAVWTKERGKAPVAKLLQQSSVEKLPAVERVEFVGEYPIAELKFVDKQLPVQVSLRAFSPHIPMNAKDSAIPAAVFEFTVRNTSAEEVQVSLLSTLQNAAGYDGISAINRVWNKDYGGNVNTAFSAVGLRGVLLANPNLKPDDRQSGTMAAAALRQDAVVTPQWDNLSALWREFSASGDVSKVGKTGASPKGRTWNSAITVSVTLAPGQSVTVPFIWAWHFPNHFVWWDSREGQPKIGRMYSNWFADAGKAAEYLAANYKRLSDETERYRRTFYKTTLPYWMLDRISAQNSTLVSTVTMWLEDGTFAGFEGAGCCPMNCTHVWNYEQQMAYLFPELERNMRRVDYEVQQDPNGAIRHRTRLPLSLPRESGPFIDGHLGCILKAYREHRLSADRTWLDRMWPRIKLAMEFVLKDWDRDQDGVLLCEQWNTYDAAMYGPNTFIGTLYLGALRAAEEMAKIEGDSEFATKCRSVYETGTRRLDSALWNGEYWRHIEKKLPESELGENAWMLADWPNENPSPNVNRPYGKGCHADQLLGQWWATQLDLGYLLPKERVNKALDSIMKYNWVPDFGEVRQWPRAFAGEGDPGLYICTWPYGEKPDNETLYSFEVWTGIEYEVAGLLIQEGRVTEALRIVKAASDRYNGVPRAPIQRNPFAEVECSNHYARAMSAWGMLLAAQGYSYSGPDKAIEFNPVVNPGGHASFFTGAEGWGLFTQKRGARSQENALAVEYGKLEVKTLTLHLPTEVDSATLTATVSGARSAYTVKPKGNGVAIEFSEPVTVEAGRKIAVSFSWR
jgi:non-lysosomal glucosylceramidase